MDAHPLVRLEGVSVIRDGNLLLDDVSWTISSGERWVLFGANGSGKTTLLQVVSSYLFPTRGSVEVLGHRYGKVDIREVRKRIGYVGTAPARLVHTDLSPLEIIVTGRHASFVDTRWHPYSDEDWVHARTLLEVLQADHLADRRFGTMSDGERKRVLIARALMASPDVLLLDEPGAGLDLGARERLIDSLATLAATAADTPVVMVTHHVEEIPPGFEHILMLAGGRVVAGGHMESVLTADALSDTFGIQLEVERRDGRWTARGR